MAISPNLFLVNLDKQFRGELNKGLNHEEELWAMKSRINWMIQGDWNTSFYHVSTLIRRKHNKILSIKDSQGEWIFEQSAVMDFVQNHFQNLFSSEMLFSSRLASFSYTDLPHLSNSDVHTLSLPVLDDEIKNALWSLKPFKSPGPNGIHAGFYQRFWLLVKDSVINEIKKVFRERKVPAYLNQTHVALIPKIKGPETIKNYRPISLCNSIYKIISKIIVIRIRPHLDKLVSLFQTAFIPGRKGIDNTIIAQEIIHTIGRKSGKVGNLVIKIDLEKAYDKLEWSFIRDVPQAANFPSKMIQLIMSCVSSSTTSILVNGGALDPFLPSREIRQGNPLSPYLFIL